MSPYIVASTAKRAMQFHAGDLFSNKSVALREARERAEVTKRPQHVYGVVSAGKHENTAFRVEFEVLATFGEPRKK